LPFFSIYLPNEFKQAYKYKYENLLVNLNKLTSPFDIYQTVRDLTCLNSNSNFDVDEPKRERSISLLSKISPYRSCDDIGIPMHYCTCEEAWIKANVNDSLIREAALFAIESINVLTEQMRHLCHRLILKAIYSAEIIEKKSQRLIKIEFLTSPNKGLYETILFVKDTKSQHSTKNIRFEFDSGQFSIKSRNEISRIDAYGDQPKCVANFGSNPSLLLDLRKFCYCITNIKKTSKPSKLKS
jgi:hypothetical protein